MYCILGLQIYTAWYRQIFPDHLTAGEIVDFILIAIVGYVLLFFGIRKRNFWSMQCQKTAHYIPMKLSPRYRVWIESDMKYVPSFVRGHVLGMFRAYRTIILVRDDSIAVTLNHEFLHHWLFWNISAKACVDMDNLHNDKDVGI